jgi:hypothetical protein
LNNLQPAKQALKPLTSSNRGIEAPFLKIWFKAMPGHFGNKTSRPADSLSLSGFAYFDPEFPNSIVLSPEELGAQDKTRNLLYIPIALGSKGFLAADEYIY